MGLTLLLLMPAVNAASGLTRVFAHGALYGLIAYGTYDLTNHATHREWPLVVATVVTRFSTDHAGCDAHFSLLPVGLDPVLVCPVRCSQTYGNRRYREGPLEQP
ncbi:MAG: hypothetical protein COV99_10795 [Bacteroidetes bacterium CG12_big_fil_rev_8_21_14_0_65_60_17]|nr:MAG: hypothetical protein COV99_10795 [Bacteroidetes bacterium CG12_big_fil_rev_8_21_14_0_65_60_17]